MMLWGWVGKKVELSYMAILGGKTFRIDGG